MKKTVILWILSLCLLLTAAGCGSQQGSTAAGTLPVVQNVTEAAETERPETEAVTAQTAVTEKPTTEAPTTEEPTT